MTGDDEIQVAAGVARPAPRLPAPASPFVAPVWPFRLLALAGAVVQGRDQLTRDNWQLWTALGVAAAYTAYVVVRPIGPRDDLRTRFRLVVEQALVTALVMLTGGWLSPVALCLIPAAMVAGFSAGTTFAAQLSASTIVVVSVQHLTEQHPQVELGDALLWVAILGTVVFTSGLSQRAAADAARQRDAANVRVNRLSEANSLLFALQRVAQTMPASLDLDDVVSSTFARITTLVPADAMALYMLDHERGVLDLYRSVGSPAPQAMPLADLPAPVRPAVDTPRTVRIAHLVATTALTEGGQCGIYTALRARGQVLGFLVLETAAVDGLSQQQSEIVHGLAEGFGIALDNARLFRQIRAASANEERARIARDLHDHIGSSLAFMGFEVDRAQELAERGHPVGPVLSELREHLTAVIHEIRETLHDLRTDVTDDRDVGVVLRDHLERVRSRSGLDIRALVDAQVRPPRTVEREIWQVALEGITNIERHAHATTATVEYRARAGERVVLCLTDDGVGLNHATPVADRYGMVGMKERAERIGALLRIEPAPGGGTIVRLELDATDPRG